MSETRGSTMLRLCGALLTCGALSIGQALAAPSDDSASPPVATPPAQMPASAAPAASAPAPVAQVAKPALPAPAAPPRTTAAIPEPTTLPEVRKYCTNIATAASEARFAWQTSKLNEIEGRLKAKIKDLDAKEAEVREWIAKREAIEKKAAEKLVDIYSKMRPETAATQISSLDDDMAAAILGQLGPRQASAIFNEIVPERAAKLAGLIAGTNPAADKKL